METKKRIYCAGPFYSPEDRFALREIVATLSAHEFLTYLPHEQVLHLSYIQCLKSGQGKQSSLGRAVFAWNLYHLVELCQGVVFSLNGRVPDEGGTITAAISFITGKPVILYKNDIRAKVAGDDNSMITGLGYGFKNVTCLEELPQTLICAMAEQTDHYSLPLNIETAVELGRSLAEFLASENGELDNKALQEIINMCEASQWYDKFAIGAGHR